MRRHAASNHWAEWEMVQSDAGVFSKVPSKKLKRKSFSTPQKSNQALIYKIFDKQDNQMAKCKLCDKTLSTANGGTSTLRRHAATNHEQIWSQIQDSFAPDEEQEDDDEEEVEEEYYFEEYSMPMTSSKKSKGSKKKKKRVIAEDDFYNDNTPIQHNGKACIYKLFDKLVDRGQCRVCGKILSALQGSTSTLRRHAARFHPEEWAEVQSEAALNPPESRRKSKLKIERVEGDGQISQDDLFNQSHESFQESSQTAIDMQSSVTQSSESHNNSYTKLSTNDDKIVVKTEATNETEQPQHLLPLPPPLSFSDPQPHQSVPNQNTSSSSNSHQAGFEIKHDYQDQPPPPYHAHHLQHNPHITHAPHLEHSMHHPILHNPHTQQHIEHNEPPHQQFRVSTIEHMPHNNI